MATPVRGATTVAEAMAAAVTVDDFMVLTYLVDVVLAEPDQDMPVWSTLKNEGIKSWRDLMVLTELDIDDLKFTYRNRRDKEPLGRGHKNLLIWIKRYIHHLDASEEHDLDLGELNANAFAMNITREEFDAYRTAQIKKDQQAGPTTPFIVRSPSPVPAQAPRDPSQSFKQSIKKDKTQYPMFKDERFWDQWNQSFTITAKSHDLGDILDPNYRPITESEISLFKAKQAFAYSVLHHTLLTDMGKTLVRQYFQDLDAQQV